MRAYLLFVFAFLMCNACFMGPTAEEEIVNVLKIQQESWNQGDVNGFMNHYLNSEGLTFAGSSGVTKGHQQVLDRYLNNYDTPEKMGTLTFTVLEFHELSSKSAYVIGEWSLRRQSDNPSGYFTLIWEKVNGEWKIIHDHTS